MSSTLQAKITVNHAKLSSFLKSFESDIKAGLVSEDEILEQLRMDIHEFVDVEMVK